MNILHVANIDRGRHMGPANSVPALMLALSRSGCNVLLYNMATRTLEDVDGKGSKIISSGQTFASILRSHLIEVVHFHGVYFRDYPSLGRICRLSGIPYIVCPRGSLVRAGILSQSTAKKVVGLGTMFGRFLSGARLLHFLTESEATNSVRFRSDYFVSGNGVSLGIDNTFSDRRRDIVFVGRMDVKCKGLDRVVESVFRDITLFREGGWRIRLYGPDHRGGKDLVRKLIQMRGIEDTIYLNDSVHGSAKKALLSASSAFIQASRHEGQPQAVLESMALGTPVIVSAGTNLHDDLISRGAGLSFEGIEVEGWADALTALADRDRMNGVVQRARQYIVHSANWDVIGKEVLEQYRGL